MNTFLKTYRLALTPLSPIHIGCGEDFEPTNYVMEDGVLYGFDPSRAALTEAQGKELMQIANNGDWLGIQRFFKKHAKIFQAQANLLIPVARGVQDQYDRTFGNVANVENNGNVVINRLALERAVSVGPSQQPYIPGSSFKGALRTSHLNDINDRKPLQYGEDDKKNGANRLEKRLYEEIDFEMSPMRLVKVSDLMPNGELERTVVFAAMRRKRFVRDRKTREEKQVNDNLATRKEIIAHGQYRKLTGEIVLPLLGDLPDSEKTPKRIFRFTDLNNLVNATNEYHLQKLMDELNTLDSRRFTSENWLQSVRKLLEKGGALRRKFDEGSAMLVRLGRYGGAESKTLDGIRSIHIPQAKRPEEKYVKTAHCFWLAANDAKARSDMLPFGWAVVEIDPPGDLPELENWCAEQSKGRPDMAAKRRAFEAEQLAAQQRKAELERQAQAQAQAQLAQQRAAQQRAAALAAMSEQAKKIETLRQQCEDWAAKLPPNGNFKRQTPDVGKAGFYQEATKLVKTALESTDWSVADKSAMADMLEQWLPQVIAPWDPKEQRKKLKFAALRGQNS